MIYFATGGVSQIKMDAATFVPDFGKVDTLVIFASFILAYMGVEASASHVNELKNPNRNYPLAMIVLAILTIALDALGGLAVATTLPASVLHQAARATGPRSTPRSRQARPAPATAPPRTRSSS